MKQLLKYSGILALVLAVVGFVLMLATPSMVHGDLSVAGTTAIFGNTTQIIGALSAKTNPSALALIGWILALVGLLAIIVAVIAPLANLKALMKFTGILNMCAAVCFILAGVFMFIVVPTFGGANNLDMDGWGIGAGWVIGAIFYIAGGCVAILPAMMGFLGKK